MFLNRVHGFATAEYEPDAAVCNQQSVPVSTNAARGSFLL